MVESRRLRALIASLPEKQRIAMILRFQEDLMPEEIAKILDVPVRTVKSNLQRASLAMLREEDRTGGSMGKRFVKWTISKNRVSGAAGSQRREPPAGFEARVLAATRRAEEPRAWFSWGGRMR